MYLVYHFVESVAIESASSNLHLCIGSSTDLDDKHLFRTELRLLALQKSASNGRSHFLMFIKDNRKQLPTERYLNDTTVVFWMQGVSREKCISCSFAHIFHCIHHVS